MTLYAPDSGIVTMKMVQEGQCVKNGMNLMTLSDISKVWVLADIYEYELPWVKVGQQAQIILPFVGHKALNARLSYLYPYLEAKTRTVKARFVLDNPDLELKPDMYVNVHLQTSPVKNALAIPAEAVLHSGEKETVFVALGDGKFEPRQVKTGLQDDKGNIQILQGLLDGETVVTSAQFMLDSESKLREAIQKMLEPKTGPRTGQEAGKSGQPFLMPLPQGTYDGHSAADAVKKSSTGRSRTSSWWSLLTLFVIVGGIYTMFKTPIDAIPDLSDVQVIIFTEYPGQAPQVVEDQVTYPLTTQMLAVPGAKVVRGYSFFGSPSSISFSKTAPISTGPVRGFSNTSTMPPASCPRG